MSPAQGIRDAATRRAEELGINPTVAIGVIEELSQYGTLVRGGRIGVFGAPVGVLGPSDETPSKWQDQLELGLQTFAKLKDAAGVDDIPALVAYIGGPDAHVRALRALERGAKHTGEQFNREEMQAALTAAASVVPKDEPPTTRDSGAEDGAPTTVEPLSNETPDRSATLNARLRAAFGDDESGCDCTALPVHLNKLIEALTDE